MDSHREDCIQVSDLPHDSICRRENRIKAPLGPGVDRIDNSTQAVARPGV